MVGISACVFHRGHDCGVYDGRPLLYLEQSLATWVMRAGMRPYLVPFDAEPDERTPTLSEMMEGLDGLVLHGGADVAPASYGEEPLREEWSGDRRRDRYELGLIEASLQRDVPILGVCRGAQLLNVAFGGTLFQDVGEQLDGAVPHRDVERYEDHAHDIEIDPSSRLSAIYGGLSRARVNSVHHQGIDELADELVVEARCAEDGLPEAVRLRDDRRPYVAGIQWHPEFQRPDQTDLLDPMPLLEDFNAAVERADG